MANRNTNIDVVFRNGLVDYESIPSHDVWRDISPALKSKKRSYLFLKIAASVIIITSMGYFAYRHGVNDGLVISDNNIPMLAESIGEPNMASSLLAVTEDVAHLSFVDNTYLAENVSLVESPVSDNGGETFISSVRGVDVPVSLADFYPETDNFVDDAYAEYSTDTYTIDEFGRLPYEMVIADEAGKEQIKRWSVAALASPTYYSGSSTNSVVAYRNEQPATSYSGGVSFAYKINKRLSVQSGVYYASIGQKVNGIDAYAGFTPFNEAKSDGSFKVATSRGNIQADNRDVYLSDATGDRISSDYNIDNFDPLKANLSSMGNSLKQNFRYVEVPVSLRYKIIDRTFDLNVIGGISSNILVGNNVYSNSDNGNKIDIGQTEGMSDFVFSSTVGMGMEYNISNSVSLNLEPMLRYYLTPVNASASGVNSFSFGIFSGLSYKF